MTRCLTAAVMLVAVLTGCGHTTPTPSPAPAPNVSTSAGCGLVGGLPNPRCIPVPAHCTIRGTVTDPLPDNTCTPGATNPAVTQTNLKSTVCVKGWTATVRPPLTWTEPLKARLVKAYGSYAGTSLTTVELDHRVPLAVGGASASVANLWPEAPPSPNPKDGVEVTIQRLVCSGHLTLAQGQALFLGDGWRTYLPKTTPGRSTP